MTITRQLQTQLFVFYYHYVPKTNILVLLALRRCESNVCLNGGTCKVNDQDRSFQCLCPYNFEGLLCESEKICTLKCQNNGLCIFSNAGKPKCNCSKEFSGELCEIGSIDCQVQGCSTGERCVVSERGTSSCMPDPCIPNPCQHNATCTQVKDTFECACTSGFEGALCANDIDECMATPCKNDAICMNTLGSFICLCKDGFRGSLCEENTLCDPNPCYNNGICSVVDGLFHCDCQPGFTSDRCQETVEECNCKSDKQICINGICKCPDGFMGKDCDQPLSWSCTKNGGCENGGSCLETTGGCLCPPAFTGMRCEHALECTVDGNPCMHGSCIWSANGTFCNCKNGFEGKNCERNVSEVDPCLQRYCNTGRCINKEGSAVCLCPEESSGEFCENTNICKTKPCMNGGECLADFTNTSGFKCICNEGFSGTRCELAAHVSECLPECSVGETCEQRNDTFVCVKTGISCDDCVHSFRCIENGKSAVCVCDTPWTGPKCDKRIEECQNLSCAYYQICRNELINGRITASCGCAPGLTGTNCTINTAKTFHTNSFFLYQSPNDGLSQSDYTLKVTFRTSVDDAHILSTENILNEIQFALSIRHGYLYGNFTGFVYRKLLPFAVNDDHWYTVLFNNINKIVSLEIREGDFVLSRLEMKERKNMGIYWTRIGKGRTDGFRGCIRDLFINGEFINILKLANVFGVIEGCQHPKLCSPNPCQNDGTCIDQWDEFRCECKKPFLSPYCIQQTDEVTFGHDNLKSRLELDTEKNLDDIKLDTNIDFLMRTNKPNGTLLYLGEKNGDDIGTFIALEILNGLLNIRTRLGGKKVFSKNIPNRIDDNKVHLISLIRDRNNFSVTVDDDIARIKFDVENRFDHPLLADTLVLGSSENLSVDAFSSSDYFKGTLQDLHINSHLVPLTTLSTDIKIEQFGVQIKEDNILQGTVSDDICSLLKPCMNGECSNTFNDFECMCEYAWIGKRCNERDHCALSSCSVNAVCTNYDGGYVCSSPATFVPTSFAKFELEDGDGSVMKDILKPLQISFMLRTRSLLGQIIYLKTQRLFVSISLKDGLLIYEASMNGNMKKRSTNLAINDGVMHTIDINQNGLYFDGTLSDKNSSLSLPMNMFDFSDNFTLVIGQQNDEMPSFDGCLENVQIGRTPPISFFINNEAGGLLENTTHFKLKKRQNIIDNQCYAENLCGLVNPCKNEAICHDLWNKRLCECRPGFTGTFCEIRINRCENHTCQFGACINGIDEYSCMCLPGYGGQFCNKEMDLCKLSPCLNGGNCTVAKGRYNCNCPAHFVGSRCQAFKSSKCVPSPCENGAKCTVVEDTFKCDCLPGFDGMLCDLQEDPCHSNPCKNGATCLSKDGDFKCICVSGYEGRICDEMKDYCSISPCVHGECKTVTDNFLCDCELGWSGEHCDIDINECMRFPCEHDGNCTNTPGSYQCSCDSYHLGDHCEIVGSCIQGPCGDNGDCIQQTSTTHSCVCRRGYTGDGCDIMIDYCNPDPCENGATCQGFIGGFNCSCLAGFTGETCSEDIDDCINEVCQNGGRCTDRVNGYECDCEGTGYQGTHCTEDIDECELDICAYGRCTNLIGSYNCACDIGYIGKRCSVEDPCVPDSLNRTRHDCVHGACVRPAVSMKNGQEMASYECECEFGYSGEHCIHLIEKKRSVSLSYIVGPILAFIMALFIVGFVLFAVIMIRGRRATQGTYSPSHHESSISRMPMNSMLKSPPEERLI